MEKVKFHFDPRCPWCWQTSRWAVQLERLGEIELDWGVFSLEIVNLPEDGDPRTLEAVSGPALRTAIAIRDTEGSKAIGPFYTALGKRVWEQPPPPTDMPAAVRDSLEEAGLDPALCDKALADPATWDAVIAEHTELRERTGAFGVPTIVLDGGTGPAIFGPVIAELPPDDEAVELFRHTAWLMRNGNFFEVKRNRTRSVDVPMMDWYREQRARQKAEQQKS